MAQYRCKLCGGMIEASRSDSVGVSSSCGEKQILPNSVKERCEQRVQEPETAEDRKRWEEKRIHNARIRKIATVAVVCAAVISAVIWVACTTIFIPKAAYQNAMSMIQRGEYAEAYDLLSPLRYRDSKEQLAAIKQDAFAMKLVQAVAGDIVYFGTYEQDHNEENGKEDIAWQVLERKDKDILLISRDALDYHPYNTKDEAVTWETCTLRIWLNDVFLKEAFSNPEQQKIVPTLLDNLNEKGAPGGNQTIDRVFVQSLTESTKYFGSHKRNEAKQTVYGTFSSQHWLRTPGSEARFALTVHNDGESGETSVYSKNVIVRPALWIRTAD